MKTKINKKFWATAFTLTGAIIGAGILGLPYVFAHSGFLIGLFWLLFLGGIIMYAMLCLGEISLRTKGTNHQLFEYSKKYLGKFGKSMMFFAFIFGIYSALLAYLIGEGQSFSALFTDTLNYSIYFALGFWLFMTLLLREGLRGLKKIETWGVIGILIIILLIGIFYLPKININNFTYNDFSKLFLPFGVILFALMGFTPIPELRMEIKGEEKKLKKAIIIGSLIPILVYFIFSFIFVGVLGKEVPKVATIGLNKLVILLGIFTMFTSYFVLSFSLKDFFKFDLNFSSLSTFILVSIVPLVIYLITMFFGLGNFITVLGIGGVVSGGLMGILILFMNKNAKKKGNRKPEYSIPINWFIIILLSLIFITGILIELGFRL